MQGCRIGPDGLLRPLIVRATVGFWADHDADVWFNQRLIVMRVRAVIPRVDKDTVRAVLDDVAARGLLIRRQPSPRRTIYRLAARYADPVAPGYAREVDELLDGPIPWVSAEGQFYRFGATQDGSVRVFPVASYPHHFAKHAWMRAWIHAFDTGRFQEPEAALASVARASKSAPIRVLAELWRRRDVASADAAMAIERSRFWRSIRRTAGRSFDAFADPGPGEGGKDDALGEEALRVLHDLCGHEHLHAFFGPPALPFVRRLLSESFVYGRLDAVLRGWLGYPEPVPPPVAYGSEPDPLLWKLGPRIRALEPSLQSTFRDHRRAWPNGLFTP